MKILNLVQGTPEWKAHRASAFNASDAPAMLGLSKYKTRNQLLQERATGVMPEVDDATQSRFNDGHRFEALARPMAEQIIGETLAPVTGANGNYSASFDGITFDECNIWEHKTLNADIRMAMGENGNTGGLAEMYRVQMEHQLYVSGADKCLFMASKWDGENCVEQVHGWYLPDLVLRKRIITGWEQFSKDLAAYVHTKAPEVIEADAIMALPAVVIQATGELAKSNLDEVTPRFDTFLAEAEAGIKTAGIENGKAIGKFSRAAAVDCKNTAKQTIAQIATVSEAVNKLEFYAKKFDAVGLSYEKEVARLELIEKDAALNRVKAEYAEHVAALQKEVEPIRLIIVVPDFAGALKNLRTVESKNAALGQALADGKIAADAMAKDVRAKLAWCKGNAAGHSALFPDLQNLISKPMEDFTLTISSRIKTFHEQEQAKLEAERARIQAEEETKARAKVEAEAAALAEQQRKDESAKHVTQSEPLENVMQIRPVASTRPSDKELIQCIADGWNVSRGTACDWILETAERMKMAA